METKFKQFEAVRWYTSGALLPPERADFEPNTGDFEIGDTVYMKNPVGAIYNGNSSVNVGNFKNSKCDINRSMGVVKDLEEKGGFMCFKPNMVSDWYKVTCATKEKP